MIVVSASTLSGNRQSIWPVKIILLLQSRKFFLARQKIGHLGNNTSKEVVCMHIEKVRVKSQHSADMHQLSVILITNTETLELIREHEIHFACK